MDNEQLNQTSELIIGAAIKIHTRLGAGLLENVYKTCLAHELRAAGQMVISELVVPIRYENLKLDGGYRVDLLINDTIVVEIKAVEKVLSVHYAQVLTYLRLLDKRLGLLINFNVPRLVLGVKRIVNNF